MQKQNNKNLLKMVIAGTVTVAVILVLGTIWTGRSATIDTEHAVRNVSLMYLDELADRTEQVVKNKLDDYVSDMDVALGLLTDEDLSSIEKLQEYQLRMKQLYGVDKFAFVDEKGLIYTSQGTRNDIDQYNFDYQTLSGSSITLKNEGTDDKNVVIASSIDNIPFNGHNLVVSFLEIDMHTFLDAVSMNGGTGNSNTYCNIYMANGDSMTGVVLGGLTTGYDNLIDSFDAAVLEEGYDKEKVRSDFEAGNMGYVSFTIDGTTATMYYVPIHNTNWMLTYLIRESVIIEKIDAISNGIVARSAGMSILTAIILIAISAVLITQTRRASKLAAEQESSEMVAQELEERIALQDELLEQEKRRAQQDNMITAMASDYRSVYYYDTNTGMAICYRGDRDDNVKEGDSIDFRKALFEYANNCVDEKYREGFLEYIKPENIKEALKKEPIIAYRYLARKNGTEYYEMLRMASVRDENDVEEDDFHALGVGFTNIDSEMRDSLAKNQALSDALKTAEEASKAKTTFLSSMSHEIRTPMNAIIGLDSLALHEPDLTDTTRDYLEKIGTSAQHLLSLINDILDMSRIESGRMTIKNEEFAFSKLIEQINVIFSGQSQEKGIDYDCRIIGHLNDYYIGDSMKLRQVLINILGNAVKFTPEGGKVELTVEKTAAFEDKSTLRFVISDTGIGMSADYLPKIFDTFSQENAGAANKYGSSGLGMAITKNIVEMMNGNIEVTSEKGVGTTFTVTVTLIDSERHVDEDEDDIVIHTDEMKVLVIDDDPIACEQARLVLDKAGISADVVQSGQEAVEAVKVRYARRELYNLIIVDWQMPEMDGLETTRQIRSIIGEDTAIIILTAYNWEDIYEEATGAGVDSFIAKPLFSGNLIDEFKNALKKKRQVEHNKKADLKGRHILLAEDMQINAQIMMKVLKMKEIEADHALNGKIAVDMFTEHPQGYYDAILMDMRMPEMDGLTATRTIRALDRPDASEIPIIALTANAFDEDVQKSLQAGLNAHLSKPIQPDILFETLENLIKD